MPLFWLNSKRLQAAAMLVLVWFVGMDCALAQTTRTWNGSASSDWFNATNWIPAGVPASNDIVNFTNATTINLTAPVTINGQFNWSGGTLSGNPLTIATNGLMTISGTATLFLENSLTNAGTVVMANSSSSLIVSYSDVNGYTGLIENLPGALWDIQNDQTISPYYTGPAYFHNAGTVRKSGQTGTTTIYIPFNNSASVTALEGTLNFGGGGVLAGTFTASNAASILFSGGNFTNSVPTTISGPGSVQFTGGNMTLLTDAIANLTLRGGNLILGPGFQGGTITNLTLSGSTLLTTNIVTGAFNWNAGTLLAPLFIATNGLLTMSGTSTLFLENTLTNAGTVVMANSSSSLIVSYSDVNGYTGLIENLPGALWDIQNDQTISPYFTGPAYFHNAGTVRKSGKTGTTTIYIPFNNSASVTALEGTLNFGGGGVLAGTFTASNAASILFSGGNFTNSAPTTINGPGLVQFTGVNLTLLTDVIANLPLVNGNLILGPGFQGGTITNLTLSGSTLLSTNIVTGAFNWNAGTLMAPLVIATNGLLTMSGTATHYLENALTNAGTVVMTNSGGLVTTYDSVSDSGLIENLPGALWDIQNDQSIYNNNLGPAYFHNAGAVRKSGRTGTTTIYIPFYNAGTVTAQKGTITFDGSFTPTGGELIFGLSSPASFGQMSISGNATLGGTVGVVWLNGFVPSSGNSFTVLNYGSFTGMFTNTDFPAAALWQTNYGPTSFTISVASINKLVFTVEPVGGVLTNKVLAPVVVQVEDPGGNPVATNGVPVTLSLNSGIGTLNGTLTQNTDPTGKATFSDLSISSIGTKTLRAASGGLTATTSTAFAIVPLIGTQWTSSGFVLSLNGTNSSGSTIIFASTNLMSWTALYTNAPTNGDIIFLDPGSTNYRDRFYRIFQQ